MIGVTLSLGQVTWNLKWSTLARAATRQASFRTIQAIQEEKQLLMPRCYRLILRIIPFMFAAKMQSSPLQGKVDTIGP